MKRDKEGHYIMIKGLIQEEDITVTNIYAPNYHTIALISHASKVMLKIPQARLQQYVNRKLPDVQAGFTKGRRTRNEIANNHWIMAKGREF